MRTLFYIIVFILILPTLIQALGWLALFLIALLIFILLI